MTKGFVNARQTNDASRMWDCRNPKKIIKVSEYDQEIPHSHTTDQLTAP